MPVFSRDGTELFFYDGSAISVFEVIYEPSFRIVGPPQPLIDSTGYVPAVITRAWDPDPNAERFLMIRRGASEISDTGDRRLHIDVVFNFDEALEELLPAE